MKRIACVGPESFTLGFRLVGTRDIINANKQNILETIHLLKKNTELGIVIVDETLLEGVDSNERDPIEESVDPVFILLSKESNLDNIRKLIVRSMGVDLLGGDQDDKQKPRNIV